MHKRSNSHIEESLPSSHSASHRSNPGRDLIEPFREYFELIPGKSEVVLKEIFRLRYRVFSEELRLPGFEAANFPDGLETDEYDDKSVHYLMRHRKSGKTAGAVRLILANSDDPQNRFPVEKSAGQYFDPNLVDPKRLPRRQTAEISRLVLDQSFRSRGPKPSYPVDAVGDLDDNSKFGRRTFPHAVLGLLVAIARMSAENRITHWYAGMEPILDLVLRRFGFRLTPIGPLVSYYGSRRPYLGVVPRIMAEAYKDKRDVWNLVTDGGKFWPPPYEDTQPQRSVG